MSEVKNICGSKMKFYIIDLVLDEFLVDMKQLDMKQTVEYMNKNTMSRMDELQRQIDALVKAIGG